MKRTYLIGSIVLFLVLLIPYFQNIGGAAVVFFNGEVPFNSMFWYLVAGGMILGSIVTLYVQYVIEDIKLKQKQSKFELQ